MRNFSILVLALVLLLCSPLLFGENTVQQYQQPLAGQYGQQSITDNPWYKENRDLSKHIKDLQTQLIAANNHIIKLYQYLEKKSSAG